MFEVIFIYQKKSVINDRSKQFINVLMADLYILQLQHCLFIIKLCIYDDRNVRKSIKEGFAKPGILFNIKA